MATSVLLVLPAFDSWTQFSHRIQISAIWGRLWSMVFIEYYTSPSHFYFWSIGPTDLQV